MHRVTFSGVGAAVKAPRAKDSSHLKIPKRNNGLNREPNSWIGNVYHFLMIKKREEEVRKRREGQREKNPPN